MTIYSVAIVGLGQIGMMYDFNDTSTNIFSHAKAFDTHSNFNIVCAIDPSEYSRNRFEEKYNCKAFETIDESLALYKPDIVVIATPTSTHLSIIRKLLKTYTPNIILCEKPLAYKVDEAKSILQACETANCNLFVNYMRRVDAGVLRIKEMIVKGKFQSPIKGFGFYSKGLLHNGSHFINLLEFWLGPYQSHVVCNKGFQISVDDWEPDIHIFFEKGAITLQAAWEEKFSHYTIELLSKAGRIRYDNGGFLITTQDLAADPDYENYMILNKEYTEIPNSMAKSQLMIADSLYKVMTGGISTICTGQEALRTLECIESVFKSLEQI